MAEDAKTTPAVDESNVTPEPSAQLRARRGKKLQWRPWLRALHRDFGYLVVGLTFVYALSGLAVNHITDWSDGDPSFKTYNDTIELGPLAGSDEEVAKTVREKLHIKDEPREVYRRDETELDVSFDKRSLHINAKTGTVVDEGQKPRFILRVANWLHLNRGKKAWTYVADSYAAILLCLALSGIFMIAGKKGFFFRGMVLVGLGILVPVLYVVFAGP